MLAPGERLPLILCLFFWLLFRRGTPAIVMVPKVMGGSPATVKK